MNSLVRSNCFPSAPSTLSLLIQSATQKTFTEGLCYMPGSVMGPGHEKEAVFVFKKFTVCGVRMERQTHNQITTNDTQLGALRRK